MYVKASKKRKGKERKIGEISKKERAYKIKKSLLPGGVFTKKISMCHF